jgi:hypothetical protein
MHSVGCFDHPFCSAPDYAQSHRRSTSFRLTYFDELSDPLAINNQLLKSFNSVRHVCLKTLSLAGVNSGLLKDATIRQ